MRDDKKKEWFVRMPHLEALGDTSLALSPELLLLPNVIDGQGLHEYTQEPTDPVKCLPDEDNPFFWHLRVSTKSAVMQDQDHCGLLETVLVS